MPMRLGHLAVHSTPATSGGPPRCTGGVPHLQQPSHPGAHPHALKAGLARALKSELANPQWRPQKTGWNYQGEVG